MMNFDDLLKDIRFKTLMSDTRKFARKHFALPFLMSCGIITLLAYLKVTSIALYFLVFILMFCITSALFLFFGKGKRENKFEGNI